MVTLRNNVYDWYAKCLSCVWNKLDYKWRYSVFLQLADFLDQFIQEQVSSVDELAHYVTILERFNGDPVGEYMFDESLYEQLSSAE